MDDLIPFFHESTADLKSLKYGEESSNGENESFIPDENIYDAVNDETFGAEISSITLNNDDGLEEFSKRTANLALFDEPSCSVTVPDPSQIPIPHMGNDFTNEQGKDKNNEIRSSSIWAIGSFNGIGSLVENYVGQLKTDYQNASREEQTQQLQRMLDAGLPTINHSSLMEDPSNKARDQPVTVEIEAEHATNTSTFASNTQAMPLSLEELERRMLLEAAADMQLRRECRQEGAPIALSPQLPPPNTCEYPLIQPSFSTQQSGEQFYTGLPRSAATNPPQQLVQQLTQHYQAIVAAAMANGLSAPPMQFPSNLGGLVPPTASQVTSMCSFQYSDATSGPVTSISQTPVPSYNIKKHLCHHLQSTPLTMDTSSMPQLSMIPSSLHPRAEGRGRPRQIGLPSGKTISDFALDPYAGFMSTKEREWLIKIHIIQCLGSGDPFEDDFYYTNWKGKNVLQKPLEHEKQKEKPKYYKFEATFPSIGYIAPSFLGSLGKPIHSSACQPRQIIEVKSDSTEEDLSSSKNRQKRLKAALMKIENGALALLDCKNIRKKFRFFEETCITEFLDQHEITDRKARFADNIAHVDAFLFSSDGLPTLMLIQKGRHIIYQWLRFWSEESNKEGEFVHICRMLSCLPKFARKMPEDGLKQFADIVCNDFLYFPLNKIVELLTFTADWDLLFISDSKMAQLVLLSLITAAIGKSEWNLRLDQLRGSAAAHLLQSLPSSALKLQPNSAMDSELFKPTQWAQLRQWLIREQSRGNGPSTSGTLIHWIVQNQAFVLI